MHTDAKMVKSKALKLKIKIKLPDDQILRMVIDEESPLSEQELNYIYKDVNDLSYTQEQGEDFF